MVPTSLRYFYVNKFKINVYQRRENLCHTIYSLFMEFMSYYFCHVSHNLGCIASRFFFFTALKRHTRVVETSGVDARDQRRKRAPFAKGLERKRAPFRLLIHPISPATQATHNYTRCLYMKFICAISWGCFRF